MRKEEEMVEEGRKRREESKERERERDGTVSTGKSVTVELQDVCFWALMGGFFFR